MNEHLLDWVDHGRDLRMAHSSSFRCLWFPGSKLRRMKFDRGEIRDRSLKIVSRNRTKRLFIHSEWEDNKQPDPRSNNKRNGDATMSVITINFEDLSLKHFATRKEAGAEGNGSAIIDSEEKLLDSRFTNSQLLAIFNSLQGPEGQVKKFSDRESAVRRTYIALRAHFGEEVPKKEKATDKPKAAKKEKSAKKEKAAKPKKEKSDKPRKVRADFKVKAGKDNPFRIGTKSHTNFQKVIDNPGKTFGEYVSDGVHAGILAHAIRLGHAKKVGAEA